MTPHYVAQQLTTEPTAQRNLDLERAPPPDLSAGAWANIAAAARRNHATLPDVRILPNPSVTEDTAVIASTDRHGQQRLAVAYRSKHDNLWFLIPPHRHTATTPTNSPPTASWATLP